MGSFFGAGGAREQNRQQTLLWTRELLNKIGSTGFNIVVVANINIHLFYFLFSSFTRASLKSTDQVKNFTKVGMYVVVE